MELWQREHITKNLDKLTSDTSCNPSVLAFLTAKGVLSNADRSEIETILCRYQKAIRLYEIVQTKTNGYELLILALSTYNQTGAVKILVYGFPHDIFSKLTFNFMEVSTSLDQLLSQDDINEVRATIQETLEPLDYFNLCVKNNTILNICKCTIPPERHHRHHISRLLRDNNASSAAGNSKTEDELVEICKDDHQGYYITGKRGAGKTVTLTKVARKLADQHSSSMLVTFIHLPSFIAGLDNPFPPIVENTCLALSLLVRHTSPTALTQAILFKLLNKQTASQTVKVFVDGYSELPTNWRKWAKKFLVAVRSINQFTLYASADTSDKEELGLLGFEYSLLPFTANDCAILLEKLLEETQLTESGQSENTKETVTRVFQSVTSSLSTAEAELFDTPFICHLVADFYKSSLKSSRLLLLEGTTTQKLVVTGQPVIFNLFKKFTEKRLGSDSDTVNILTSADKPPSFIENGNAVKRFHVHKALQLAFPQIATKYAALAHVQNDEAVNFENIGRLEISQQQVPDGRAVYYFQQQAFAEYLLTEFFTCALLWDSTTDDGGYRRQGGGSLAIYEAVVAAVFENVMLTHETSTFSSNNTVDVHQQQPGCFPLYSFTNLPRVYFLDCHLKSVSGSGSVSPLLANIFCSLVTPEKLYRIIQCCISQGYWHILQFCKNILKACCNNDNNQHQKYKDYLLDQNRAHQLLLVVVVQPCSAPSSVVNAHFQFYQECFQHDLKETCKAMANIQPSPIQLALKGGNTEMVRYLVDNVYSDSVNLLQVLLCNTRADSGPELQTKMEILRVVVQRNVNTLQYIFAAGILSKNVHVDLIKCLFLSGCNFYAADYYLNTIAHHIARNICGDEYHLLVGFVKEQCGDRAGLIFGHKNRYWRTGLHEACQYVRNLKVETVRMIKAFPGVDINAVDENGNSSFMAACAGALASAELLQGLIELGADVQVRNRKGENGLHLAVQSVAVEAVRFLSAFSEVAGQVDCKGNTAHELAVGKLAEYQTYPNSVGSVQTEAAKEIVEILRASNSR